MEISEVRVRLVNNKKDRLKAVCTVTLDDMFVVRDVKVVEGTHGVFVAMPSRKLSVPCPECRTQNHLRAKHCNECGRKLPQPRIPAGDDGREKVHRDIAHPITATFRQTIQESVLEAFNEEFDQSEASLVDDAEPEHEDEFEPEDEEKEEAFDDESDDDQDEAEDIVDSADEDDEDDEDAVDPDDEPGGINEYDSIIADLRRGQSSDRRRESSPSRSQRDVKKEDTSERPQRGRGGRGRGGQRDRKREETAAGKATGRREESPPPAKEVAPPKPKPVVKREEVVEEPERDSQEAFGLGIADDPKPRRDRTPKRESRIKQESSKPVKEVQPAPIEAVAPVDVKPEEPAEVEADDDSSGFGAGIL